MAMIDIELLVAGKLKKGPYHSLQEDYQQRIRWPLIITEIESRSKDPALTKEIENRKIYESLNSNAFVVVMDERGEGLRSLDFAETLGKMRDNGVRQFQFIIGGSYGLNDTIRDQASFLLSFGRQTWPHLLARIMLLEQIYRAQQILSGHPYHKE